MADVFRAPIYVPKPPESPGWLRDSLPIPLVLALAPAIVLPFENPRAMGYSPPPTWQWKQPVPLALYQLPAIPIFGAKGTKQFNLVPEPQPWQWTPPNRQPLNLATFRIDNHRWNYSVPEPGWTESAKPVSPLLQAYPPETIKGTRQLPPGPEIGWVGRPAAMPLVAVLPPATPLPFRNLQPQQVSPDPIWSLGSRASPLVATLPPVSIPFHNTHSLDIPIDIGWTGHSTQAIATQYLPARPPATVKGTRQFNFVAEPAWSMHGSYSIILYIPTPPPSTGPIQRTLTGVGL